MKKQSVDILDEATSFEQRMSWIMFQHENEEALKVIHGEKWRPGIPIYDHPVIRMLRSEEDVQCVRTMFDLFSYDDMWYSAIEDESGDLDDEGEPYLRERVRCMECDVDWYGEEPCFVCGEVRIDPRPPWKQFEAMYGGWGEHIHVVRFDPAHFSAGPFQVDPERMARLNSQMQLYATAMAEQLRPAVVAAGRAFSNFATAMMDTPEFRRYLRENRLEVIHRRPRLSGSSLSQGTHDSPGAIDISTGVNLPPEVIEQLRANHLPIPQELLPEVPAPRPRPPWQVPITEQRRRRRE